MHNLCLACESLLYFCLACEFSAEHLGKNCFSSLNSLNDLFHQTEGHCMKSNRRSYVGFQLSRNFCLNRVTSMSQRQEHRQGSCRSNLGGTLGN